MQAPWNAAFAALGAMPVDVVATIGSFVDPATFHSVPPNVRVERFVPHGPVLERASIVASHAGAGTLLAAAAFGLPQLLLPLAADQWENADALADAGAGLICEIDQRSVSDLSGAFVRLLDDTTIRQAAERLAVEINEMPAAADRVPEIARLAPLTDHAVADVGPGRRDGTRLRPGGVRAAADAAVTTPRCRDACGPRADAARHAVLGLADRSRAAARPDQRGDRTRPRTSTASSTGCTSRASCRCSTSCCATTGWHERRTTTTPSCTCRRCCCSSCGCSSATASSYSRWRNGLAIVTAVLPGRSVSCGWHRRASCPTSGTSTWPRYYGMSVYGPVGTGVSDQFAAMPSIHVGWAAVVSFGVVAASTSRWRWLFLLHVLLTVARGLGDGQPLVARRHRGRGVLGPRVAGRHCRAQPRPRQARWFVAGRTDCTRRRRAGRPSAGVAAVYPLTRYCSAHHETSQWGQT